MCDNCKMSSCNELPKIADVFLILTERCNLACKYCFVQQNPREMTLEIAMKAIKMIIANAEQMNKVPSVWFFGGEPLLKWDEIIVPVTNYLRNEYNKPCNIGLTSNCVLMSDDKIDYMVENKMTLLFSFDGNKTTQDINRPNHAGTGSFDRVYERFPKIIKALPHITIRATIDHDTAKYTFENMKFLHEHGIAKSFFYTNSFAKWTDEEYQVLSKQFRLFSDYYIEKAREGVILHHGPLDDAIHKVIEINKAIDENKIKRICGDVTAKNKCGLGASTYAAIGTDGSIYGCQEMPSQYMTRESNPFFIGDIDNGVDDGRRKSLIGMFKPTTIEKEMCNSCKLNPICDGGCVANNYLIQGDFNTPPETFCKFQQMMVDEAIYIMQTLGEEKNEVFRDTYFKGAR